MEVSKAQVQQVLNTLPLGYYTGNSDINATLTEEEGSYFKPMTGEIFVSYPMISNVLEGVEGESPLALEGDLRCLLYHEVSHSLLTPKYLMSYSSGSVHGVPLKALVNIFEDERIESLLRAYYKGVNFRAFVKKVNKYKEGEKADNPYSEFYQIVRYREGDKVFVDRVHDLILKYKGINANDNDGLWRYTSDIEELYNDIVDRWKKDHPEYKDPPSSSTEPPMLIFVPMEGVEGEGTPVPISTDGNPIKIVSPEGSTTPTPGAEDKDGECCEGSEGTDEGAKGKGEDDESSTPILTPAEGEETTSYGSGPTGGSPMKLGGVLDKYKDTDLISKFINIFTEASKVSHSNASAVNSYSGIFNPRSVIRDDYKYFDQKNRMGHMKRFSKIHLNLFIDTSGSFWRNDQAANQILYALSKVEKTNPNFTYDLVTMQVGETLQPKNNREIQSNGGNWLDKKIFDIYKKLQDTETVNMNLVLFDGDAFTDVYGSSRKAEEVKNFKAFNHGNVTIISDPSNRPYIESNCKNAKKIYTVHYVKELHDHVVKSLKQMSR